MVDPDKHVDVNDGKSYGTFEFATNSDPKHQQESSDSLLDDKKMRPAPPFRIDRLALTQANLDIISPPFIPENTFPKKIHSAFKSRVDFSCASVKNFFKTAFPILRWLPEYSVKNDLLIDIITGFTLLILHVPQGMAYAQLAAVPPVYGLYTSFYPVLVYFFLGTSRHISMGTFAVSSLLAGTEVENILKQEELMKHKALMDFMGSNSTSNATVPTAFPPGIHTHSNIEIAMVITFTVGILQTAMGILRMGSLTSFMSDEMISGFIVGTVIHIFTGQLRSLTGGTFAKYSGPFNIIFTWIELFQNINTFNYVVILISLCSLTFLILVKEIINNFLLRKCKFPIPAELILVIIGTALSYRYSFNKFYHVEIVGLTPTGLLPPVKPPFELLPQVLASSTVLAVICAATTLSMVLIYAKKHEYEVDTNQELVAYGVGGIFSSFFFCIPSCASLSRSAIQDTAGAKSQICSIVSCALMLVVLLALGPLFEFLPSAVLSAVIVVSLKSMFMHFRDLGRAWNASKLDALVWLITFLSVVVLDMDYGLIIGILFALITILFRSQYPETCLLGNLSGTEIYRNTKKYPNVAEIPGIKIFHFGASLYFGNRDYFRSQLFHLVSDQQSLNIDSDIRYQAVKANEKPKSLDQEGQLTFSASFQRDDLLKVIIIELSAVAYIDSGGVSTVLQVIKEFAVNKIEIYLACVQESVLDSLESQGFSKVFPKELIFPTIHDAVLFAQHS